MGNDSRRMARERKTIIHMIELYCRGNHGSGDSLCPECQAVMDYALKRLNHCSFAPHKPTCAACPVHCYQPEMRHKIKVVMRFAGPRMLLRHPFLALMHVVVDKLHKPSALPFRSGAGKGEKGPKEG